MQLILWRHAQAANGRRDLERELTAKGRKQAAKMAAWLRQRMPDRVQVFVSPALRAQQTADALSAPMKTINRLAPGAAVADVLDVVSWPGEEGGEWAPIFALRLATLFLRSRTDIKVPLLRALTDDAGFKAALPQSWLDDNPLTADALDSECGHWKSVGMRLVIEGLSDKKVAALGRG